MSSQVSIICPPDLSQRPFSANRRTHDAGVANCPVSGVDRTDGLPGSVLMTAEVTSRSFWETQEWR
jgi:hypothetical protein